MNLEHPFSGFRPAAGMTVAYLTRRLVEIRVAETRRIA